MTALWWQTGVIYQIYPRSFQDMNGDGIGDLRGIERRLDYLASLGVDAIWMSPIYPSPMADFGYDVADYCGIDSRFGTLDDFDDLLAQVHARGLKLLLDFVPNHTSDRHPWFVESRSSRVNPKRDWYIWRDPAPDGGPPNNWISDFGGSAWEWDEATGQYYYHAFLKEQADLNWRNPAVQTAMYDVMRARQEIFTNEFRSGPTRAEKTFKKEGRAQDSRNAMTEYECQAFATPEKTARLKELRLAKEAQARSVIAL
jgi:alpha-glucosidase